MKGGLITLQGKAGEFTRELLVKGLFPDDYSGRKLGTKMAGSAVGARPLFELRHYIGLYMRRRLLNGIFRITSLAGNITSSCLCALSPFFLNFASERDIDGRYVKDFRIKTNGIWQEMWSLFGGNQQKAVIARALTTNPCIVILDEPARGIDAGSAAVFTRLSTN
jgi:ABC-type sugar transport system ATPase subunit